MGSGVLLSFLPNYLEKNGEWARLVSGSAALFLSLVRFPIVFYLRPGSNEAVRLRRARRVRGWGGTAAAREGAEELGRPTGCGGGAWRDGAHGRHGCAIAELGCKWLGRQEGFLTKLKSA